MTPQPLPPIVELFRKPPKISLPHPSQSAIGHSTEMSTSRMTTRQEPLAKPLRDGIRRKRIVLSCLTCKGRKVRCDRQAPVCMRCIEAGYPERCRYDERSVPSSDENLPAARTPSPVFVSSPTPAHHTRNVFPARTDFPTATSNAGTHPYDSQPDHPPNISPRGSHIPVTPPTSTNPTTVAGDDDPTTEPNSGRPLIQGASLNTQFHGMTHSINIIGYFDGLRAFLQRTATDHPVLGAHRWAVQNLAKERHQQGSLFEVPEAVLKRSLPPEPVCRSLMITYFKHFEGIFRILHAPSFWRHYDAFWAQSTNHLSSFTALLLSAISCARCLYVDNPLSFDGDCSASRAEAIRWVRAAESWHDQQSPKHTTLDIIQIKCLIMLSKRVNAIKLKRHYTESQTLLANAISIGLHRSPSSLGDRASVYEKEMRRRLWGTISELELAESMERGVPSLVASLYSDIEPPANIKDEEFDETTTSDLVLQDDKTMTASSFARYAHQFRPLQHTINNLINNPERHKSLSSAELNTYHEQIFNRFFDLQPWPTSRGSSNYSDASFLGCIFIQVQLHRLLIMLHLPFSMGKPPSVTTSHSRLVCSNSSKAVIGIYTRLVDQGYSQMCLPRTDLMRATLCLCLIESTATSFETIYTAPQPNPSPVPLIESALNLVEERILALGDGFRGFWLIFAASCSISQWRTSAYPARNSYHVSQSQSSSLQPNHSNNLDPSTNSSATTVTSAAWQEKIVNHVIVLCSKICLCQVTKPNGARGGQESANSLFARYMKHIQRTSVYAKVETGKAEGIGGGGIGAEGGGYRGGEALVTSAPLPNFPTTVPDLGTFNPLMEGAGPDDWLESSMDDFGFSNWTG